MSHQQMSNEVKYRTALLFLQAMVSRGLLTVEEFCQVDQLNRQLYRPQWGELYQQKQWIGEHLCGMV